MLFYTQFADGWAYSKGKMEEIFRSGVLDLDAKHTKKETPIPGIKKEDVDVIVRHLPSIPISSTDTLSSFFR